MSHQVHFQKTQFGLIPILKSAKRNLLFEQRLSACGMSLMNCRGRCGSFYFWRRIFSRRVWHLFCTIFHVE
jgi:hypothetical protein